MEFSEYKNKATEITQLFSEMDDQNNNFSKKFNIGCVSSCGGCCCKSIDVEVSPIDLIPMVISIIETNQIELVLKKLDQNINNSCIFFENSRCSIYKNRPVLCRLFGNVAVPDKNKNPRLSICSYISKEYSHPIAKKNAELAPNLVDYSQKISNCMPSWDSTPLPINKALDYAIKKIYTSYLYK